MIKKVNSVIEYAKELEKASKDLSPIILSLANDNWTLYAFTKVSEELTFINQVRRGFNFGFFDDSTLYDMMMDSFGVVKAESSMFIANGVFYGLKDIMRYNLEKELNHDGQEKVKDSIKKEIGEAEFNRYFGFNYQDAVNELANDVYLATQKAIDDMDISSLEKARKHVTDAYIKNIDDCEQTRINDGVYNQMIVAGITPKFHSDLYAKETYVKNLSYTDVFSYLLTKDQEEKKKDLVSKLANKIVLNNEERMESIFNSFYAYWKSMESFKKASETVSIETKITKRIFDVAREAEKNGVKNLTLEILGRDDNLSHYVKHIFPKFSIEGKIIKGKYPVDMVRSRGFSGTYYFSYDKEFVLKEKYSKRNRDYLDDILVEDVIRISFGKKVLYSKDEFLKELGVA